MKHEISEETIDYIGILAKLELSQEERRQAREDMSRMLEYMDKLEELDTRGVEPMTHLFPQENVFREDIVVNGDMREEILKNGPKVKEGTFQVPKTVE